MFAIGLDVGGTKTELICLELVRCSQLSKAQVMLLNGAFTYKELARLRCKTDRSLGYGHWLETVQKSFADLMTMVQLHPRDIGFLGVGLPGSVDSKKQCMVNGNSRMFIGHPIAKDLQRVFEFSGQLRIYNDANCFAFAEAVAGSGLQAMQKKGAFLADLTLFGVILGTGVGGGYVHKGSVLTGAFGGGCEVGHVILKQGGHPCFCGQDGCVEQYLSGPAIEALFLSRMYSQIDHRPCAQEIFALADEGDPMAFAVLQRYQQDLLDFLRLITVTFNPQIIVLGGGVSRQGAIYSDLEERLANITFVKGAKTQVCQHQLGDSAGVLGAVFWAVQDCLAT